MSVTTKHQHYVDAAYTWETLRSAYIGSGAVKSARDQRAETRGVKPAGTRYLPMPTGMTAEQYSAYRDRARWLGATEHAVHGLTGAGFRREPVIEAPARLEPQLEDVTQTGVPLRTFAEQAVRETLLMGRFGVLVDFPQPVQTQSGETAPAALARPYWIAYQAEEILNWRTLQRQGDTILSLVVLRECVPVVQGPWGTEDFFKVVDQVQYRVLRLDEDGRYEVSLWVEQPQAGTALSPLVSFQASWIPTRTGVPLDFIPFVFLAPFSLEPAVEKSLLEGLVEVNYLNYRHSADKEHGLHYLIPTPYVCSDSEPPAEPLLRGSNTAWWILGSNSKVGQLDGPASLQPFESAMAEDVREMAALGARLLEPAPLVPETATGVVARTAGADSPMQALLRTVSQGLTQALQVHAWWGGVTENVDDTAIHMTLNTDLVASSMEPQMLTALTQALLQNTISYETYWFNLQKGEVARPMIEADEEQELIAVRQEQQPLAPVPGQLPPQNAPPGRNGTARQAA